MKAEIFNNKYWIDCTESNVLKYLIEELLTESSFTILGYLEHSFVPHGFTCLWLLSESHLALHTFPEEGRSYIELSSCNLRFFQLFCTNFIKKCTEIKINILLDD